MKVEILKSNVLRLCVDQYNSKLIIHGYSLYVIATALRLTLVLRRYDVSAIKRLLLFNRSFVVLRSFIALLAFFYCSFKRIRCFLRQVVVTRLMWLKNTKIYFFWRKINENYSAGLVLLVDFLETIFVTQSCRKIFVPFGFCSRRSKKIIQLCSSSMNTPLRYYLHFYMFSNALGNSWVGWFVWCDV